MTDERLKHLREKSMKLPMLPGVYIMHAKSGEIIYVGKAKKLPCLSDIYPIGITLPT